MKSRHHEVNLFSTAANSRQRGMQEQLRQLHTAGMLVESTAAYTPEVLGKTSLPKQQGTTMFASAGSGRAADTTEIIRPGLKIRQAGTSKDLLLGESPAKKN